MHVLLWRFSLLVTSLAGVFVVIVFLYPAATTPEHKEFVMLVVLSVSVISHCIARAYDEATNYHQRRAAADQARGQSA